MPPHQTAVVSCLELSIPNDSIFYTRTMTGCKSPPGPRSAIPTQRPGGVEQPPAGRRAADVASAGVARSPGATSLPWDGPAHASSFSTTAGMSEQQPLERKRAIGPRSGPAASIRLERHRARPPEGAGPGPPQRLEVRAAAQRCPRSCASERT